MSFTTNTILESTDLPEKARREVPRVMNRLLGKTFLYQGGEADKEDYYLVHRHRDVFTALFSDVWIIHRLIRIGANIINFIAFLTQVIPDNIFKRQTKMVRSNN